MKNYIQKGDVITVTASADITGGSMVVVGSLVGIAVTDIANGAKGEVALEGVYEVGKEADDIAIGVKLYHKSSTGTVTTTATSNTFAGYAFAAAGTAATTVQLKLAQ